jgi:hypothetical protein
MTLQKLIEIIIETVERHLAMSRFKVFAVSFGDEHGMGPVKHEALLSAAHIINGEARFATASACMDMVDPLGIDALFVDYLPFPVAAEIALGLATSPFGTLAHYMLARGKPVFVLEKDPRCKPVGAYRELYRKHWAALASFGVIFLGGGGGESGMARKEAEDSVFCEKKVLSRADVVLCKAAKIVVSKDVIVTDLAKDTARALNINIVRG